MATGAPIATITRQLDPLPFNIIPTMVKTKIETVDELVDETLSDDNSDGSDDSHVFTDEELIGASLLNTRTSEQFASNYKLDPEYQVSIHVPDVGLIDMPLKKSQARQLIAKAHPPAPHNHGGGTTTDASAGKIWELGRNQFGFGVASIPASRMPRRQPAECLAAPSPSRGREDGHIRKRRHVQDTH
ncbi:hypothetical protein NW759_012026 [Fusarium solani]|nr:hypothetical protein NW759_012026 [Fusarium solani]